MMLALLLGATLVASQPAESATATSQQIQFFETRMRPLLVDRCLKCHGAKKQWGGLRLDSRASLLRGGDSGPAVVPGRPDESLLLRAIRQVNDDLKMPKDAKLPAGQIAAVA